MDKMTVWGLILRPGFGEITIGVSIWMGSDEPSAGWTLSFTLIGLFTTTSRCALCVETGLGVGAAIPSIVVNGGMKGFRGESEGFVAEDWAGCSEAGAFPERVFSKSSSACLAWMFFGLIINAR